MGLWMNSKNLGRTFIESGNTIIGSKNLIVSEVNVSGFLMTIGSLWIPKRIEMLMMGGGTIPNFHWTGRFLM